MGKNTRPSSKENSSECGKERRTKLRNIIDSQSVKTVTYGDERGIDGGKKRKVENDTL